MYTNTLHPPVLPADHEIICYAGGELGTDEICIVRRPMTGCDDPGLYLLRRHGFAATDWRTPRGEEEYAGAAGALMRALVHLMTTRR